MYHYRRMPKCTYTPEFLAGYIRCQMETVRRILYRLENQVNFTIRELENVRIELDDANSQAQFQAYLVKDESIRPIMKEFFALMQRSMEQRERRVQRQRAIGAGDDSVPRALQIGEPDRAMVVDPIVRTREDLEPYASDNEEPFPLELMSAVRPGRNFEPVRFEVTVPNEIVRNPEPSTSQQADLRDRLEQQHAHQSRERDRRGELLRGRGRGRVWQSRTFVPSQTSERSRSIVRDNASVTSTASSYASYVSRPMEELSGPVGGRTFPPIRREPPTPLVRNDPGLIGSSEVYVHPPQDDPHMCPKCTTARHKLFQCTTFLRMGLQEKWYTVLKLGVCLHCLIRGHSHFSCKSPGTCWRCHKRHNSKICPNNPNNV